MRDSADNLDLASENEDRFREEAIRNATTQKKAPPDFDGKNCVDCGSEIPEGRLNLAKYTCIYCQTIRERYHGRN